MGPLDISGGLNKDQRALRKDPNKHVLALNKKLMKPLTGNKANSTSAQNQHGAAILHG